MSSLRILLALALVIALLGGATAGAAVAQGSSEDTHCGGLHTADDRTDETAAQSVVGELHHQCHHGNLG
jgi:hypothetical protein